MRESLDSAVATDESVMIQESIFSKVSAEDVPANLNLRRKSRSSYNVFEYPGKRTFDIFLSALGLIGFSVLGLIIAIAIKIEDGGPVFYTQERVGKGGRRFPMRKFRSMVPDAEYQTGPVLASENDTRATKIGRILRATAMDELPQLWNILRGDLSFVGPRPERSDFVERFDRDIPGYCRRHVIRPGLTGLAQLYGRYDSQPQEKLICDLLYFDKQSFWLDLKLIALSFWVTFRAKWEDRSKKF